MFVLPMCACTCHIESSVDESAFYFVFIAMAFSASTKFNFYIPSLHLTMYA